MKEPDILPEPRDIIKITKKDGCWAKKIVVTTQLEKVGGGEYSLTFADGTGLDFWIGVWGYKRGGDIIPVQIEIMK